MLSEEERRRRNERLINHWAQEAPSYDKRMGWAERRLLGEGHRQWVCSRATGAVLEVAIGTGLNIPFYGPEIELTGLDLSPEMLRIAGQRANDLGRTVELREGDAHRLPFADEAFDSVVCTFSLCNIPDLDGSLTEMRRVLRPRGNLLLLDHVKSSVKPLYWLQKALEVLSLRIQDENMTRRPVEHLDGDEFEVRERERFRAGVVERVRATKTP
jgi:ubiquinone/menaquinone biosynthesis C-methylase UbiE